MSVDIGNEPEEQPPEEGEFGADVIVEDDYGKPPQGGFVRPTSQQLMQSASQSTLRRRTGENFAESEVELDSRFITPEAKMKFQEFTRDVRASNYSDEDVELVCMIGEILRMIDIMENRYFGAGTLQRLREYFDSDLQYIANSRAGYKGFISQLAKTQRMESVPTPMLGGAYEQQDNSGIGGLWGKIRGKGGKKQPSQIY